MSRTQRALAMLALCLAMVSATTAVAAAAPAPTTRIEDQNDRLLRNLEAGQAERTQAAVELARSMERNLTPVAGQALPAQAAVELARSMERNLTPVAAADMVVAQPAARIARAVPGAGVDVLATLLLGLVGGLIGGGAAVAGWTATTRRRLHRAAAA